MRIITFGSSHSVGYGLPDVKDNPNYDTPSKFSYANITAEYFGVEHINLAKCGNSIDQIHADILSTDFEENDVIILQVSTNPSWFKLITPNNKPYNVMNPDSLVHAGLEYTRALHGLLGTLTGDNHWRRLWFIHFYSIMQLLSTKKVVWFFDRYLIEYFEFDTEISTMPVDIQNQIKSIRDKNSKLVNTYIGEIYSSYLNSNCPESVQDNGHYSEIGHRFWAEKVVIPAVDKLTK
jgi:hypothetical protein